MKRTINEIYSLISDKKQNAQFDLMRNKHYPKIQERLKGEIEAYTDVLCLIESSGVLDEQISNTPIQIEPIGYSIEKDTLGKNR